MEHFCIYLQVHINRAVGALSFDVIELLADYPSTAPIEAPCVAAFSPKPNIDPFGVAEAPFLGLTILSTTFVFRVLAGVLLGSMPFLGDTVEPVGDFAESIPALGEACDPEGDFNIFILALRLAYSALVFVSFSACLATR